MNEQLVPISAEQSVIGSVQYNTKLLDECGLTSDDFGYYLHKIIWQTFNALRMRNTPIDLNTCEHYLQTHYQQDGAFSYLAECMNNIPSAANVDSYVKIVKECSTKRKVLEVSQQLQQDIFKDDFALDQAIKHLMSFQTTSKNYSHDMESILGSTIDHIEKACKSDGQAGISTGLVDLDKVLGGFHKTDAVFIGARPAMGKTALLLNMALNANAKVGIISAEQAVNQIGSRLLSIDGCVNGMRMRNGDIDDDEWAKITQSMSRLSDKSQMWINDEPGININSVCRQARKWKHDHGIEILYVDYVQKIKSMNENAPKHERVGEVASELKNLAKELDIPVVSLAQVGRQVEQRPDKRPHTSDLSDSSEIEKEADVIMMLYRDEVYDPYTDDKGVAEILTTKNRHGATGLTRCVWIDKYMQFRDFAPRYT